MFNKKWKKKIMYKNLNNVFIVIEIMKKQICINIYSHKNMLKINYCFNKNNKNKNINDYIYIFLFYLFLFYIFLFYFFILFFFFIN